MIITFSFPFPLGSLMFKSFDASALRGKPVQISEGDLFQRIGECLPPIAGNNSQLAVNREQLSRIYVG